MEGEREGEEEEATSKLLLVFFSSSFEPLFSFFLCLSSSIPLHV